MNKILKTWTDTEFIDQYWTATDSSGCKWLEYNKFVSENPCEFNILVATNGTGKTWSLLESFFDGIMQGKKQIWGRIRATEATRCVQEWSALFARHNIIVKNGTPQEKIMWTINRDGVWYYTKLMMPFIYMSNIAISQPGGFEGLERMVIDEVLWNQDDGIKAAQPIFKDPIKTLLMLQDRARVSHQSKTPQTFLIANMHQPQSDFFTGLNYFPDWAKLHAGESDLMIYETPWGLKVSVVVIGDKQVGLAAQNNWKIANQIAREKRLNVRKYAIPRGELQKIWEFPDDFEPWCNINWNKDSYTIGWSNRYDSVYVMKKPYEGYDNLEAYSIAIADHTSVDLFLANKEDVESQFSSFLRAKHKGDMIRYDAPYTQENIALLIRTLDLYRKSNTSNRGTH